MTRKLAAVEQRVVDLQERIDRNEAHSQVQLKRISELQAELDLVRRAWEKVRLRRRV